MKYKYIGTVEQLEEHGFMLGQDTTCVPYWNYGRKTKKKPNCPLRESVLVEHKKDLIYIANIDTDKELSVVVTTEQSPRAVRFVGSGELEIYFQDLIDANLVEVIA